MFKSLITLMRGQAYEAAEDIADRHALTILDQQMRDAAQGLDAARRALAVAIASDVTEMKRLVATAARIADLETRAVAALEANSEELATEAAEAIAALEADRIAGCEARKAFSAEIVRLKRDVAGAESRLAELERGRRIARAAEAVRRLRNGIGGKAATDGALADAEATLKRLRARQVESAEAERALAELTAKPANIADVLAAAGFGAKASPNAAEVLVSLKNKVMMSGRAA
jgi:phage shock protein A